MGAVVCTAGICVAPCARADRQNTRYTQELDCAEWNVGEPYSWRLASRFDLYFASIGDSVDDEYDANARRHVLHYDFEPISTLGFFGTWAVPGTGARAPLRVELGYASSRLLGQSGAGDAGEERAGALASLGLDSRASEVLDIGLAFLGLTGRVGWQHFAAGHVREVDRQTGETARSSLRLDRMTGRLAWNLPPFELFEEVDGQIRSWRPFGFTIYVESNDYSLPRILYRYRENGDPGPGEFRYTYVDETERQQLRTLTYAAGGTFIFQAIKTRDLAFTSHLELGGAFGGGAARFKFHGSQRRETLYLGKMDAAWLSSFRFGGPDRSLFELGLQYNFELLSHFTGSSGGTFFEPSATDAFHGPRVEFIARF